MVGLPTPLQGPVGFHEYGRGCRAIPEQQPPAARHRLTPSPLPGAGASAPWGGGH